MNDLIDRAWQLLGACAERNTPLWAGGKEGWTLTVVRPEQPHHAASVAANESEIRADERRKCWEEINSMIVSGPLPGNGCDRSAQNNGVILAANKLLSDEPSLDWRFETSRDPPFVLVAGRRNWP